MPFFLLGGALYTATANSLAVGESLKVTATLQGFIGEKV